MAYRRPGPPLFGGERRPCTPCSLWTTRFKRQPRASGLASQRGNYNRLVISGFMPRAPFNTATKTRFLAQLLIGGKLQANIASQRKISWDRLYQAPPTASRYKALFDSNVSAKTTISAPIWTSTAPMRQGLRNIDLPALGSGPTRSHPPCLFFFSVGKWRGLECLSGKSDIVDPKLRSVRLSHMAVAGGGDYLHFPAPARIPTNISADAFGPDISLSICWGK